LDRWWSNVPSATFSPVAGLKRGNELPSDASTNYDALVSISAVWWHTYFTINKHARLESLRCKSLAHDCDKSNKINTLDNR